jgi:hypothetical protein
MNSMNGWYAFQSVHESKLGLFSECGYLHSRYPGPIALGMSLILRGGEGVLTDSGFS